MVCACQREDARAMLLDFGKRGFHGLDPHDLPITPLTIEAQQHPCIHLGGHFGVGNEPALQNGIDIARCHADAM